MLNIEIVGPGTFQESLEVFQLTDPPGLHFQSLKVEHCTQCTWNSVANMLQMQFRFGYTTSKLSTNTAISRYC